jgi:hypothetical protein
MDGIVENIGRCIVDRDVDVDKLRPTVRCGRKANDFHAITPKTGRRSALVWEASDPGATPFDDAFTTGTLGMALLPETVRTTILGT